MPNLIAIDPGIAGAIAFFSHGWEARVEDMPVRMRGKKHVIDGANLAHMLDGFKGEAVLELVSSRPGESHARSFAFGRSFGTIEGVLTALGIRITYVTSIKWKRGVGLPVGSDKEDSRSMAIERFPALAPDLKRKMDHGRAEALLIGHWALNR